MKQLLLLAEMRQASVSSTTLSGYWTILETDADFANCQFEDLVAAVRAIFMIRREEGETAFPEFARVAGEVKLATRRRINAAEDERRRREHEAAIARCAAERAVWEAMTPEEQKAIEQKREEEFNQRWRPKPIERESA